MSNDHETNDAAYRASLVHRDQWAKTHSAKEPNFNENYNAVRQAYEAGFLAGDARARAEPEGNAARPAASASHRPTRKGSKTRPKTAG